jgi:hypothetical protein
MENNILHEVRKLYLAAQKQFTDVSTKEPLAEYWRGQVEAFYIVLSLLQGEAEKES